MTSMQQRAEAAGLPVHHFDLQTDERMAKDPFAVWDELYDNGPLWYSTGARGYFVAAEYDVIKDVMQDHATWSNSPTTIPFSHDEIIMNITPENMDPPVHTKYKRSVIDFFSPKNVEAVLEPRTEEICLRLAKEAMAKDDYDFIEDFATKLPSELFLGWLGVDDSEFERMFDLARAFTDLESAEQTAQVTAEITEVIEQLFEARRAEPKDDLASQLIELTIDGEPMDRDRLLSLGFFLSIAGNDTTTNVLGMVGWYLATHLEEQQQLREHPEGLPHAIEEIIRLYVTIGPSGRTAKANGEIRGCPVEPGDRIFIARTSADRRLFDDVDLQREGNRHSAFGLGPHRCVGSHLARMEIKTAFEILLANTNEFRVPEGFVPEYTYGSFSQNLKKLPLIVT